MVEYVGHHIAIGDPERPGPWLLRASVRAHQPGAELGRDIGQPLVDTAPAVVEQVRASLAGGPRGLMPPGIHADHDVGVASPDRAR